MEESVASNDPYSSENIGVIQFIMLGRIYDTLMALLTDANPQRASDLLEMHSKGVLMGPSPFFNGTFITDEVNRDGTDT